MKELMSALAYDDILIKMMYTIHATSWYNACKTIACFFFGEIGESIYKMSPNIYLSIV